MHLPEHELRANHRGGALLVAQSQPRRPLRPRSAEVVQVVFERARQQPFTAVPAGHLCVYIYRYVRIHMYIYILHISIHLDASIYLSIYLYINICMYIHTHMIYM